MKSTVKLFAAFLLGFAASAIPQSDLELEELIKENPDLHALSPDKAMSTKAQGVLNATARMRKPSHLPVHVERLRGVGAVRFDHPGTGLRPNADMRRRVGVGRNGC